MGKDENTQCAYHHMRDHHTEDCHQLKREIEILIQRGQLLSYMKYVKGSSRKISLLGESHTRRNSPPRREKVPRRYVKPWQHSTQLTPTSLARKRYTRSIMHVSQKLFSGKEERYVAISFSRRDSKGVLAHENEKMVIKVQNHELSVKRVLIDPCSFVDILYQDTLKGMNMDTYELLPFRGTLARFFEKQIQVLGNFPIMTAFEVETI